MMTYKIAALAIQPVLVTCDEDGNLGPVPPNMSVPPLSVAIADIKGTRLFDQLVAALDHLNAQLAVPEAEYNE